MPPPPYKPTPPQPVPTSPVGRAFFADPFDPLHTDADLQLKPVGVIVQMYGWLRGYLKRVAPKALEEIDEAT